MQKLTILLLILGFGPLCGYGQAEHRKLYEQAFDEQHRMLKGELPIDFKRAVYITENAYHNGTLNYDSFKSPHSSLKCNRWRSFTTIYFPGSLPPQTFPRAIL